MSRTSEYDAWGNMKWRCHNNNHPSYHNYGGRGITVCDRWRTSFKNFLTDMGMKPTVRHTLERLDNNAGYHAANCVWATRQEQQRNTRIQHNNTTGLTGVYRTKYGTYLAYIEIDGKRINLGTYKTLFNAACARKSGEVRYWA